MAGERAQTGPVRCRRHASQSQPLRDNGLLAFTSDVLVDICGLCVHGLCLVRQRQLHAFVSDPQSWPLSRRGRRHTGPDIGTLRCRWHLFGRLFGRPTQSPGHSVVCVDTHARWAHGHGSCLLHPAWKRHHPDHRCHDSLANFGRAVFGALYCDLPQSCITGNARDGVGHPLFRAEHYRSRSWTSNCRPAQ